MHPLSVRQQAREAAGPGVSISALARRFDVSRPTIRAWLTESLASDAPGRGVGKCPRCQVDAELPRDQRLYSYLLGQYLGDGYLVMTARAPVLRLTCCDSYPGIMCECETAMLAAVAHKTSRVQMQGCTWVRSYSKHWPCLLPQHGPGPKHKRPIVLEQWQQQIVQAESKAFLRGLIHSDGCRCVNQVVVKGKRYSYPRYFFSNKSADIMRLCQEALDRVGAQWRMNNPHSLSVARRDSVALLDTFIGPKY